MGDALGSVAVIVGAILIQAFGWNWADPVAGALIGALILFGAWRLVRESVDVLMASVPASIEPSAVETRMESVPGVRRVHDLHIWTLTTGKPLLSAHVELDESADADRALLELHRICRDEFEISHCTIQPEKRSYEGEERCT